MFSCTECEFSTDTLLQLQRHECSHVRRLECTRCQALFRQRELLDAHVREMHITSTATQTDAIPPPAVMARLERAVPRAPPAPTPTSPGRRARTPKRRLRERLRPQRYRRPSSHAQRVVPPPPR